MGHPPSGIIHCHLTLDSVNGEKETSQGYDEDSSENTKGGQ